MTPFNFFYFSYMKTNHLLLTAIAVLLCSFKPQNMMAPVIVYKMRNDYSNKVPVTLSADKKKVASYPAPTDVYYNGKLALPTVLANGYYLDNRGIGANTAFTKYTYEEYSKLSAAPSLDDLYHSIIDKDPFTVIYVVDKTTGRDIDKINEAIKKKDFSGWKVLKKSSPKKKKSKNS
jgi:hypothetical protein